MLNISDIHDRLRRNPEPAEISDVRKSIKERFKKLEFVEEGHHYYLHKDDGTSKEMNSVSLICHLFEPHVGWDEILKRKAAKLGMSEDNLRREWRENNITSTSNGSLTHLFAEAYMYFFIGDIDSMPDVIRRMQYEDGYLIPYGNKQKAIAKYYEDLYSVDNFYAIMPEAQIYIDSDDNKYGIRDDISGTFDALFGFYDKKGKLKLSIRDWKTNKSLENDYNQSFGNTLLYPFDKPEFINEPKSIYTLQLSLYQLGIQQLDYDVADRKLLWLTDDGDYHKIDVPDVTKELVKEFSEKKHIE